MPLGGHNLFSSLHKNIPSIANCHVACFPNSLSGKLGLKYVIKTFEWFLAENNRFLFHIENEGKVVGYCGGFISRGLGDGSSSGMLQHAFKEAVIGIIKKPWLAFHPEVRAMYPFVFRNVQNFFSTKKKSFTPAQENQGKLSGLVVIGVHPQYRGTGIFDGLMLHFFEESKRLGAIGSKLSVKRTNARGINAYKKFDWEIIEEHDKTIVLKKIF